MKEFRRNKKTGILEVWDGDKKVGEVRTMGDDVLKDQSDETGDKKRRRKRDEDRGKR